METNEFKKMFGEIAKENGFERAFEGWFKESPEVILVLELQKSNFGNYYYLNIKLFIQGVFGNQYTKSKTLVKVDGGDIFLRQPDIYSQYLNLDNPLHENERKEGLARLFEEYINPFSNNTKTKQKIKEFHKAGNLFILPAVKEELGI